MPFQPGSVSYTQGFGSSPNLVTFPHLDVRAPATTDIMYPIGQRWINTVLNNEYSLTSQSSGTTGTTSTWTLLGAGSGDLNTLTGDSGGAIMPSAGNINVTGASTGLTFSGSSSTLTLTGTLAVANGGTGATTLTGVLTGHGTSAVTASAVTQHGVVLGGASNAIGSTSVGTNGQVLIGSTGADPAFSTITTSTGVSFTAGAHTLAIDVKSGGYAVTQVAGTTQALASQTTFIANAAGLTTFTLPATASVGDMIQIVGSALNTGGWKVTYTTNQIIWGPGGNTTVTTGNAASAAAAAQCMTLINVVANTTWVIINNSGTITLT